MLFNSLSFAVFLPVVFLLYWAVPHRFRVPILLAASYWFYMSWNVKYVVLILFTTAVSYGTALALERTERKRTRKWLLTGALAACLGLLFVFKYLDFFFASVNAVLGALSLPLHPVTLRLMLPVGISFYTFQTLSYVIDVYRGKFPAERNFFVYATFVSFFPQLVAGPIERTENLLPQIRAEHVFDYDQATYGLKLMAWGFFKKLVIADNLCVFVDKVYHNVWDFEGLPLIVASLFFLAQIYCDFSGYSDIARGTSMLLGIRLMENFKSAYLSASIREFWSRNHISLSTWFRDYVYIPLGGSRCGKLRHNFNLLATFTLSGLWHGASWTFVLWGALHGLGQIVENALHVSKSVTVGTWRWLGRVLVTFTFCAFGLVFFRAQTLPEALYVITHSFRLAGLASPVRYVADTLHALGMVRYDLIVAAVSLPVLIAYDYASLRGDVIVWLSRRRAAVRWAVYLAFLALILCFRASGETAFVYFQF